MREHWQRMSADEIIRAVPGKHMRSSVECEAGGGQAQGGREKDLDLGTVGVHLFKLPKGNLQTEYIQYYYIV